jgi:hypothetical protein
LTRLDLDPTAADAVLALADPGLRAKTIAQPPVRSRPR